MHIQSTNNEGYMWNKGYMFANSLPSSVLTESAASLAVGLQPARRHKAGMHKIITLSSCARIQSKQGHVTLVGKLSVTIPNTHPKMSVSGEVTEKGKAKDLLLREGAEKGFPKDWKLNKNMHAVAADNRDSGCERGLASLEKQSSAYPA